MFTFESVEYRNIIYFDEADLDLGWRGTTVVAGLNKNATVEDRRNGAGKTLLMSAIPHLLHGSPVGLASSLVRNSLFTEPSSKIRWRFTANDGSRWSVEKRRKPGKGRTPSVSWALEVDGENVTPRTSDMTENALKAVFSLTDDQFWSTVYLDGRRQFPILSGTPSARQNYLASLFGVEGYDGVRKWLTSLAAAARDKATEMEVLEKSLSENAWAVEPAKSEKSRLKAIRREKEKVRSVLDSILEAEAAREQAVMLEEAAGPAAKYDEKALRRAKAVLENWDDYDEIQAEAEDAAIAEKEWAKREKQAERALRKSKKRSREEVEAALAVAGERVSMMEEHLAEGSSECAWCGSEFGIDDAKDRLAEAEAEVRLLEETSAVLSRRMPRPIKPKTVPKPDTSRRKASGIVRDQTKYAKAKQVVDAINPVLAKTRKVPEEDADKLKARLSSLDKEYTNLSVKIARRDDARERHRDLTRKMEGLKASLPDAKVIPALVDAYGAKGLRLMALEGMAAAVSGNINKLTPFLYPERMAFGLSVGENRMDVVATRQDGRFSDVRHLSGAESRVFSLLWLASTLPMMPDSKRCNLVVLDEFEAGLDEVSRSLLVDEYLPKLQTMVPHILFVTPFDPVPGDGRRVLHGGKIGQEVRSKGNQELEHARPSILESRERFPALHPSPVIVQGRAQYIAQGYVLVGERKVGRTFARQGGALSAGKALPLVLISGGFDETQRAAARRRQCNQEDKSRLRETGRRSRRRVTASS